MNLRLFLFSLLILVIPTITLANKIPPSSKYTLSGYIKDKSNGEALIGAGVYIKELKTGTATNLYGFFSISVPEGKYTISISYVGYASIEQKLELNKNTTLNIELDSKSQQMEEVVVTSTRANENVTSNQMSVMKMKIETIRKIPAFMGEVDIIKVLQMMPGVQAAGEGASGFSVRGGSTDQNLILLDEATVYNASHLMGFFSVFNNDAVKEIKLFKGDIPAEYGGRLSSLLDVRQKEGNSKQLSGSGGIGFISSRLTLEGPIIKDRTSFVIAGRRSYADLFLPLSPNKDIQNNTLYFYDLNMKLNHTFNEHNRLFLSGYMGRDIMKMGPNSAFGINWGNKALTVRWNHLFSEKLFSNFTFIKNNYDYQLGLESNKMGFDWTAQMQDHSIKADFGYFLNPNNTIKFGFNTIHHHFQPGITKGTGEKPMFNEIRVPATNALEHGIFISNEQTVTALLSFNYGLRYSIFQSLGKGTVYNIDDNFNVSDSVVYDAYKIYNTYSGLEPRLGAKFILTETSSIKASYSRTNQYLQLASNSTVGTPLDIWLPASPNIKPQRCDQMAVGYFRNFRKDMFETSLEVYYKKMQNQIDFKDFAQLLMNPKIEGELRFGQARAYGIEMLLKKSKGKLTGWLGYTYSKAQRKIPQINNNTFYNAPYDRPHDVSVVLNYEISKRVNVSATWIYATGSPVTFPTGRFDYGNTILPVYSDRNAYRMPDYHRLDLGVNIEGKEVPGRRWHNSWTISIYNAYNRHNAYSIDFKQNEENPTITEAYKTYLFPIIPSFTYNFKF